MYQFGPEIEEATIEWLKCGAKFPETLVLQVQGAEKEDLQYRSYRILDRDDNGVVHQLKVGRRGKKGFVLRVEDVTTGQHFAAKLCIPADYDDRGDPLSEIEFAKRLRGAENLILLPTAMGRVNRFESEPKTTDRRPWICYLSDWLDGVSLDEFVKNTPELLTPSLVANIAKELITAVMFLEQKGLKHDDLTLGNLILVDGDAALAAINPEKGQRSLRVIDLGSAKYLNRITTKPDDDWSNVARCLAALHNVLHKNRAVASRYPAFLAKIAEFILALSDNESSRHFPNQGDFIRALQAAEDAITIEPRRTQVFHPLDAISAEHLASDEILLRLFVEHLPWIRMVETKAPVALIGPRGCGKSMVFRFLAVRTHISSQSVGADLLDRTGMFGVYIGCASDLGNDLSWMASGGRDLSIEHVDDVIDYFNLVLARELMRSLASASTAKSLASRLGITKSTKAEVINFVESAFHGRLQVLCLAGMEPLQACADALDRLRLQLGRSLRNGESISLKSGGTFIRDLCRLLVEKVSGFQRYTITFLLDDYTAHRLTPPIQSILNTVAFQRDASHLFKISSEPYGFDPKHYYGSRIDAEREYVEVDAGELTVEQMDAHQRRQFITQLLNKRLETARFIGRVDTLIGESEYKEDTDLAQAIRAERKGRKTYYNGLQVLANAWSGDVATVLHMVRDMFANGRVLASTEQRIPNAIQHEAIVRVSKGLRERVSGLHPFGAEMSNILGAFGDLAQKLLVDSYGKARDGTTFPHRKYRIEMTLPEKVELEAELRRLRPDGQLVRLYRELVRRAVFHELAPSRGKEATGRRTVRLQVRASFLPSFGTSLIRHNHLKIARIEEFVDLLTEPARWADSRYRALTATGGLFGDLGPVEEEEA